jgi:hypothetical protein
MHNQNHAYFRLCTRAEHLTLSRHFSIGHTVEQSNNSNISVVMRHISGWCLMRWVDLGIKAFNTLLFLASATRSARLHEYQLSTTFTKESDNEFIRYTHVGKLHCRLLTTVMYVFSPTSVHHVVHVTPAI